MRAVPFGVLIALLLAASVARAQGVPVPSFVPPTGDRSGDAGSFSGFRLSAPLRLSLQSSVVPRASEFPNCASREDAAGNSVQGFPIVHYAEIRLTPRLVLSGFSQLGCPIDAGIGGVATYAIPMGDSLRLSFGAGFYAAPGQMPLFGGLQPSLARAWSGESSAAAMAARADVVWKNQAGRPFHIGVESLGRVRQAVTFGGGF